MSAKKKVIVEWDFEYEAEILRVLSHPVRLKIVNGLIQEASNVKGIWTRLDLPQATVSQHLTLLKSRGIVEGQRSGTMVTYSVQNPFVRRLMKLFHDNRKKEQEQNG